MITGKSYRETATQPDFDLVLAIRKRRLRYLGHVLRMSDDRLVKRTLVAYVSSQSHGIPDGSLLDDPQCNGQSLTSLKIIAADRRRWSKFIDRII